MSNKDKNCIFCMIIKGEIPCNKIFENKNFLVFLDIKPVSSGHLLIIPKKHIVWMQEADDKTIADIYKLAKKMMHALKNGLRCDYIQLSVIGNEIPHFHIHLMPRYKGDNFINFQTKEYKKSEAEVIKRKIIKSIK